MLSFSGLPSDFFGLPPGFCEFLDRVWLKGFTPCPPWHRLFHNQSKCRPGKSQNARGRMLPARRILRAISAGLASALEGRHAVLRIEQTTELANNVNVCEAQEIRGNYGYYNARTAFSWLFSQKHNRIPSLEMQSVSFSSTQASRSLRFCCNSIIQPIRENRWFECARAAR